MTTRHSTIRSDYIEYALWLVFDAMGGVRMSRGQPGLNGGERAVSLTVKLPTSLFKIPQMAATLTVAAPTDVPIQIDVDAAEAALRAVVGCDVAITVTQ